MSRTLAKNHLRRMWPEAAAYVKRPLLGAVPAEVTCADLGRNWCRGRVGPELEPKSDGVERAVGGAAAEVATAAPAGRSSHLMERSGSRAN